MLKVDNCRDLLGDLLQTNLTSGLIAVCRKENTMTISFFTGFMGGAIVGYATQSGHSSLCAYMRAQHPTLLKMILLAFALAVVIIPSIAITMETTAFFWGGCMVFSFIFSFVMVHCYIKDEPAEA